MLWRVVCGSSVVLVPGFQYCATWGSVLRLVVFVPNVSHPSTLYSTLFLSYFPVLILLQDGMEKPWLKVFSVLPTVLIFQATNTKNNTSIFLCFHISHHQSHDRFEDFRPKAVGVACLFVVLHPS